MHDKWLKDSIKINNYMFRYLVLPTTIISLTFLSFYTYRLDASMAIIWMVIACVNIISLALNRMRDYALKYALMRTEFKEHERIQKIKDITGKK